MERFTQLEERKHDLAINRVVEAAGAFVTALEDPYVEGLSADEREQIVQAILPLHRRIDRFLGRPAGRAELP